MRSVLAVWCVAASRFWTVTPQTAGRPLVLSPAAQPVAWLPRADGPVMVAGGFLAIDQRRAPLPPLRAPLVLMDAPPPPAPKRQGATVDQDGKSNVWAVEPAMQTEASTDKGLLKFLPVIAIAVLALLALPLLPSLFAANPDQA